MALSTHSRLVQVCGYLAAFLPGAAIFFSQHVNPLRRTPLAISFVLIAGVSRTFDRGPSLLAPIITALCFNYVVSWPQDAWALSSEGLIETSIILSVGLAIAYLFQGQRQGERSLRWKRKRTR